MKDPLGFWTQLFLLNLIFAHAYVFMDYDEKETKLSVCFAMCLDSTRPDLLYLK
jgi:hypothetical protein